MIKAPVVLQTPSKGSCGSQGQLGGVDFGRTALADCRERGVLSTSSFY